MAQCCVNGLIYRISRKCFFQKFKEGIEPDVKKISSRQNRDEISFFVTEIVEDKNFFLLNNSRIILFTLLNLFYIAVGSLFERVCVKFGLFGKLDFNGAYFIYYSICLFKAYVKDVAAVLSVL